MDSIEALPQRDPRSRRKRKSPTSLDAHAPAGADAVLAQADTVSGAADASGNKAVGNNSAGAADVDKEVVQGATASEDEFKPPIIWNFEYLDHTADVQIHSWGANVEEAFAGAAVAMFNYMTPLESVSVDPSLTHEYEAQGHDMHSLLFAFLDELLYVFSTEMFVARAVEVLEFDRANWKIRAKGMGEAFEMGKHAQGTEVKAITYSNMQVQSGLRRFSGRFG
eukprot:jgi/Mesvir1/20975/Mv08041-RA.2